MDGQQAEFYNLDMNIIFDNVFEQIDGKKSLNKYVADFFDVLWQQMKKFDGKMARKLEPTVIPTPYG